MRNLLSLAMVAATASAFAYMPVYSVNIDAMPTGDVASDGVSSLVASGGNNAAVIADPTGAGRGQVIKLSAPIPRNDDGSGNFRRMSGAIFTWGTLGGSTDLANASYTQIRVKYDVYVVDGKFQNLYYGNSGRDTNFGQTINDGRWFRFGGTQTANGTVTAGRWWSVELVWDKAAGGSRAGKIMSGSDVYNVSAAGLGLVSDPTGSDPVAFYRFNIRTVTDFRPAGPASEWYVDNFMVEAVPEPASMAVLGLGALALIRRRRA